MLRHGQSTNTQKVEQNNTYQPRPPQGAHNFANMICLKYIHLTSSELCKDDMSIKTSV